MHKRVLSFSRICKQQLFGKMSSNRYVWANESNSEVRKKYVNEKFIRKGAPICMKQKPGKNVLTLVDEGDAANIS